MGRYTVEVALEAIDRSLSAGIDAAGARVKAFERIAAGVAPSMQTVGASIRSATQDARQLGSLNLSGLTGSTASAGQATAALGVSLDGARRAAAAISGALAGLSGQQGGAANGMRAVSQSTNDANAKLIEHARATHAAAEAEKKLAATLGVSTSALNKARAAVAGQRAAALSQVSNIASTASAVAPALGQAVAPIGLLAGAMASLGPAGMVAVGALAGVAGAGAALAAAINETRRVADLAEEVDKLSKRTGVAPENIQGLQRALADMNIDAAAITVGFRTLNKAIAEGDPALKMYGITATDAWGALEQLADAMPGLAADQRVLAASQLLGARSGEQLIPVLLGGAAGLREIVRYAKEAGIALDAGAIAAALRADEAFDKLDGAITGLRNTIGVELLPIITPMVEGFDDVVRAASRALRQISSMPGQFILLARSVSLALDAWELWINARFMSGDERARALDALNAKIKAVAMSAKELALGPKPSGKTGAPEPDPDAETGAERLKRLEEERAKAEAFRKEIEKLRDATQRLATPVDVSWLAAGFATGVVSAEELVRALGSAEAAIGAIKNAGGSDLLGVGAAFKDAAKVAPDAARALALTISAELAKSADGFRAAIDEVIRKMDEARAAARRERNEGVPDTEPAPQPKATPLPEDASWVGQVRGVLAQIEAEYAALAERMTDIHDLTGDLLWGMAEGLNKSLESVFLNLNNKTQTIGSAIKKIWKGVVDGILEQLARLAAAAVTKLFFQILGAAIGFAIGGPGGAKAGWQVGSVVGDVAGNKIAGNRSAQRAPTSGASARSAPDVDLPELQVNVPPPLEVNAPVLEVKPPRIEAPRAAAGPSANDIARAVGGAIRSAVQPIGGTARRLVDNEPAPQPQPARRDPMAPTEHFTPLRPEDRGLTRVWSDWMESMADAVAAMQGFINIISVRRVTPQFEMEYTVSPPPTAPAPPASAAQRAMPPAAARQEGATISPSAREGIVRSQTAMLREVVRETRVVEKGGTVDQRTFVFPSYSPRDIFMDVTSPDGKMRRTFDLMDQLAEAGG